MIWVRPFEIIPAVFSASAHRRSNQACALGRASVNWISTTSTNNDPNLQRLAAIVATPGMAFAGTVALYALYNLKTFGSWEPSYSKTINSMGFSPGSGFKL